MVVQGIANEKIGISYVQIATVAVQYKRQVANKIIS